ncbi:MAG: hypothetical protein ACRD3A_02060 [Terriglobales bacterium]
MALKGVAFLGVALLVGLSGFAPPVHGFQQKQASSSEKKAEAQSQPASEGRELSISEEKLPAGSKVYVAPMPSGFETYLIAGLHKKKVPLVVVADKTKAAFEISGVSESEKAGWAKMLFLGSAQSAEQASIKITNLQSGAVVFAYSVHKSNSARGKQSAGEACAKHIGKKIQGQE